MTSVLMTADAVGGVWTYALELADALAAYDVDVHLAVMGPSMSDGQRAQLANSAVRGVHERSCALEWMDDPWADVDRAGEWLLGLDRELAVDVVHLNGYAHAPLPWRAPTVVVAHSDVVSWWRAVHHADVPAASATYVDRVGAGLRAADAVVAPTAAVLDDLARSFGFHGGRVVANCRRTDWMTPRQKEPMVVGAGRAWDEAKNLARLEAVAPRVPWPVDVAAGLPWDELADLLLRASVFAAPARYEPFGLGPLEAALAGCALVLGDIPSLREVWGDAAAYVDPDDEDALAAALTRLAGDPDALTDLAGRSRARAARYSPAATARGYLDVYDRLPARAVTA